MDGNEGVSLFTKVPHVLARGKWLIKSVIVTLLIALTASFCFDAYWGLSFAVAFVLGCFIALYIIRHQIQISSIIVNELRRTTFACHMRSKLCDAVNCGKRVPEASMNLAKPWMDLKVPQEVDEAIEEILNLVLERHIYSWYSTLSTDDAFIQEIRISLRFIFASVLRRALRVDLVHLIIVKTANILFQHLECYWEGRKHASSFQDVESSVLHYLGSNLHTAMQSRKMELSYLRQLTENLMPYIIQKKYLHCRSACCLVREIFSNLVFLPVMDIIADPDIINHLLILFFDKTPMIEYPDSLVPKVEFLSNFVTSHDAKWQSMLHTDLRTVLEDQNLLYLFMSFLKEECSINILQFLLAVDDFNALILNPDLSKKDLESLHLQAQELYNTYFAPNSVDHINFEDEIIYEIKEIISGPPENIEKLRTTTPLFRAYDHAYSLLEQVYCPMFQQTDKYFHLICGERCGSNVSKGHGRGSKKGNSGPSSISKLGNKLKGVFIPNIDEGQLFEEESGTDLAEALLPDLDIVDDEYSFGDSYRMDNDPRLKKLSAWRVFIPRIITGMDQNCKYYHAYHIEVQRIDVQDHDNPEDLHWKLERRYNEFYVLEAKLTEFHGELPVQLPPKRSQHQKGMQFLESRRLEFEKFLQILLTLPSLQGSELLYKFLRTPIPFTSSFLPDIKLGKMIKTVPRKLIKEKGQNLLPFLQAFVASTESAKPKPSKMDWNQIHEFSSSSPDEKLTGGLFGDNYASLKASMDSVPSGNTVGHVINLRQIYDYIYYLAVEIVFYGWKFQEWVALALVGCDTLLREPVQIFTGLYLDFKLQQAFKPQRLAEVLNILRDVIFFDDDPPRTRRQKFERARQALKQAKDYFPGLKRVKRFEDGLTLVFEALQCPLLNKQLSYVLLDMLAIELFPELQGDHQTGQEQSCE